MLTPRQRLLLSLDGLSVGDALGERFFGPPGQVTARIAAREVPPGPWRWTDDTAMALSVCEGLLADERLDQDRLARAFARRHAEEPGRGYGRGAVEILETVAAGTPWELASRRAFGGQGSLGNGGAMRAAPIGAFFAEDLTRVVREARASAEVTHAHPEGQAGAVAVALAAAWAVRREPTSVFDFVLPHLGPGETRAGLERAATLSLVERGSVAAATLGAGERVSAMDTVPFSLWCVARHPGDYVEAFWTTVEGLGDRDTTCAIVGGVVALRAGPDSIPAAWLRAREPLPLEFTRTA